MRQVRISFKLTSSLGTPLHADTIFGHICWAMKYLEGDGVLTQFLRMYDTKPPLLVSDAFPALLDMEKPLYYLPFPSLPVGTGCNDWVKQQASVSKSKSDERQFATAWKALGKKKYLAEKALQALQNNVDIKCLLNAFFQLKLCPLTMDKNYHREQCKTWQECPALGGTGKCNGCSDTLLLRHSVDPVTHNVLNRWSNASENLYVSRYDTYNHGFHMLVSTDETVMPLDRLMRCMDYIANTGFGRDASIGKGAMTDIKCDDYAVDNIAGANAFINLSSAYVPQKDEFEQGWYTPYVKRGKLGAGYVLTNSPWKKPLVMLRAGSVHKGNPNSHYGALIHDIHYELPDVVQYGYAYVMGVKLNV